MEKTVRISYYPILATKIGEREFAYKGRPNRPNLVVSGESEGTQYIATKLTIGDDEISITHEPTTNFHRNITVKFDGISIEELDDLQLGESKEIAINTYIRKEPIATQIHSNMERSGQVGVVSNQHSWQQPPTFRRLVDSDEIVFSYAKPTTTEPIIEGACSSKKQKETDKALSDLRKQYDSLLDMLNSLKGSGNVNTTYQYMDPEGDMSCQLMEDTSSPDVNVFRQAIYDDKTIKDHAKKNKKLSDAATALSIGMFCVIAIVLMGILLASVYFVVKSNVGSEPGIDKNIKTFKIYRALDWTFIGLYILGFGLLFGSGAVNVAGIVILCITFVVMMTLFIVQQPKTIDVLRPILPASLLSRFFPTAASGGGA